MVVHASKLSNQDMDSEDQQFHARHRGLGQPGLHETLSQKQQMSRCVECPLEEQLVFFHAERVSRLSAAPCLLLLEALWRWSEAVVSLCVSAGLCACVHLLELMCTTSTQVHTEARDRWSPWTRSC